MLACPFGYQEMTMLLLLTSAPQQRIADRVSAECDRRGVPSMCLQTERFPQDIVLAAVPDDGPPRGWIECDSQVADLAEIEAVWCYLPGEVQPDPELDSVAATLLRQESRETLQGLYRTLEDRPWINPPHAERAAGHRLYQLRLAASVGFTVPQTLLTNRPERAAAFLERCGGQMIYKPVSHLVLCDEDGSPAAVGYATAITRESLREHADTIQLAPCLFQELVPKRADVTAYVIGRSVWAALIESQAAWVEDRVDYRRNGLWACAHVPLALPAAVERMCRELTAQMGLRMCNIDLALTEADDYVFLDANPTDLWAGVEELTGLPLCAAVVDALLDVDTLAVG
jgi:glutathione synthase/RimK-type ligase-like ATP-grasp enzyme